ncbi:hypothetical protein DL240_11650 [Lujinxingia litoralis]|uniref:Uncharacterized protein n=1 Tax=Lujinxingia litoralis TaxID=2211119 RepID=A0A328C979_9DELT|nr:low-density lipoprotein receptor class A repeat-containing protein [Lujinxingia litoralis]RAL21510.1 hypothetical protein DL240_11650 [Lujinxingia litoralis]
MKAAVWSAMVMAAFGASLGCGQVVETLERVDAEHSGVDRGYEAGSQCGALQEKLNSCRLGRFWQSVDEAPDCSEEGFEASSQRCQLDCVLEAACEEVGRSFCEIGGAVLNACLDACLEVRSCDEGRQLSHRQLCDGVEDCADGSDEGLSCVPFMAYLACDDPDFYERRYTSSDDDDDD